MDVPYPESVTIALDQCLYKLKSDIKWPIPPGTRGLILGRSSLIIKRIAIHVKIIDSVMLEK